MTTDTEALRAPQPAAQQGDARVTLPDDIERMAVNRYRPVPSGVLAYKVVGGDGDRSLFSGTKDECQIVARKLTEAFLDGAHVALAAKAETVASKGRWYVLSGDGMATLCADEDDAKEVAADADLSYPRMAPHRAVQLVPAEQLAAAVAREREPQMPEGWAFYSADFSSNAADAFKPGSVLLTRTGRNRAAWLAMSEEDKEVNALYASGRGFTLDEAVRAAIHCVDAIRAGAKESSDA